MTKNYKVRISGLVKAARLAREQLAVGIPREEMAEFRSWVRRIVAKIERICREYRATPEDLPAPSRRAYHFFKDIDLDDLPEREGPAPQAVQTVRVSGIVAIQNYFNARIDQWAASESETPTEEDPEVHALLDLLVARTGEIERLAEEQGGTPGNLPTRSRRAYQWLKFLSDPATLVTHMKTVRALREALQIPDLRKHADRRIRHAPVEVHLGYMSYLFKAGMTDGVLQVKIHEGFMSAPPEVVKALACVLLSCNKAVNRKSVDAYAAGEDFMDVVTALELTTADAEDFTQGRHFDLETVFDRVNATYFDGEIERPRLTWNARITRAKMGHYDFFRDTVMLSVTLDAPEVPDFVIDFVMYHELLHKVMGAKVVNGRRYAHTPAFREAERTFPRYEEAEAFLKATAREI
jgi:hypothetical protein